MNYTSLQTDIAGYLHRSDLTATIPSFIERAEAYLFRELRLKETETSAAGTTTTGGYGALPADFGSVSRITVTVNGSTWELDYSAAPIVSSTVTDPNPKFYSLETNQIRIFGAGSGCAYTLFYIPALSHLSGSVATNWLTTNCTDLLLYASCLEAARYLRDVSEINALSPKVADGIDSVKRFNERRGLPSTGGMQVRPRRGWNW